MKKCFFLAFLVLSLSLPIMAQGFYFDVGLGLGTGWTSIDGNDFEKELEKAGADVSSFSYNFNLKAGYGPFKRVPLFIVGSTGFFAHRIFDKNNYIEFNTYLFGAGLVLYPIKWVQLASGVGISIGVNETDMKYTTLYNTEGFGYVWDVSLAFDIGGRKHGCLLGANYITSFNTLEVTELDINSSAFAVFIKYVIRNRK